MGEDNSNDLSETPNEKGDVDGYSPLFNTIFTFFTHTQRQFKREAAKGKTSEKSIMSKLKPPDFFDSFASGVDTEATSLVVCFPFKPSLNRATAETPSIVTCILSLSSVLQGIYKSPFPQIKTIIVK